MLDLTLAILHHLTVFTLLGCLCAQYAALGGTIGQDTARRLAAFDTAYGASAAAILAIGFSRAIFTAKGWDYYAQNPAFWAKIAVFATIGLLSIRPTLRFRQWSRQAGQAIGAAEAAAVRRTVLIELALFPLLPIFAAIMARSMD